MKKTNLLILFFISFLLFSFFSFPYSTYSLTYADDYEVFPISTEMQIGKIRNLIERAPEQGIYVTVGGERAFRGASMYRGIDDLIIFDLSPQIIKFNLINTSLLKAKNKESYKRLRWESDFSEWKQVDSHLTEEDFTWWSENIRNLKGYDIPERLNKTGSWNGFIKIREKLIRVYPQVSDKYNNDVQTFLTHVTWEDVEKNQKDVSNFSDPLNPLSKQDFEFFDQERKLPNSCVQKFIDHPEAAVDWGDVIDYKSGNYLFDDRLYARLHDLAVHDKIKSVQLNLSEAQGQKALIDVIQKTKNHIAVLDLDNLYLYEYMGEINFRKALEALIPYGTPGSVLILMYNYKDFPCTQFSIYVGFTFEQVKSWPKHPFFDNFIKRIPPDIYPLIDGRLYESGDRLPFYLIQVWR